MTQALPQVSLGSSRLVRFLTDLSVSDTQVSHRQFTERLGQLIDFSDSITLSEAHARTPDVENTDTGEFREGITSEFLRARSTIVQAAMRSFFPGSGPSRLKWPRDETVPADASEASAPYLKFYLQQQADIDSKIRGLHLRTRSAIAALSVNLARISAIDEALSDALASHSRRYLAAIPRLLGQRLGYLYSQYRQGLDDTSEAQARWLETREQYRRETQGLLLAEIEARLLPALGLIEALNEEINDED
ncbi:DUF3348 family protein [Seongchinamella sediminis]|uniref:DUF3348 family protein n=1 Tax=Seongchinamella sediminis TaxID=2283635 RepID=A0A3L7DX36_9GAMM|nr:DUF3348 family protein [Seongchinamella sediminis]RLQ21884.1 DUF3348 family protein [Seongchinamella sediminis]